MDLLAQGSAWLEATRKASCSSPVTYIRGNASVQVQATIGATDFQMDNGDGLIETFQTRDYLIQSADLVLAGEEVLPARGDKIQETVADPAGGVTFTYEVLAPGSTAVWRYSDPYRTTLRIHTKLVSSGQ